MDVSSFNDLDIIVICGLPGSGKSHFAKNFFKENDRQRISRKVIRKYLYTMSHFGDPWSESYYNETDEVLVKHVEKKIYEHFLHNNRKIIIDNTCVTASSRRNYFNIAQQMKKSIGVIFLNTPVEKCLERNKNSGDDQISSNVITNLFASIKLPNESEGFKKTLIIDDY